MKQNNRFLSIVLMLILVFSLVPIKVEADSGIKEVALVQDIADTIRETAEEDVNRPKGGFIGFISNPLVNTILLILAFTCLVVEFFVPGFGLFSLISLISFILFFLGGWKTGSVDLISMSIFALGLILIFIELMIPGFGVAGITGILSLIVGLVLSSKNISHGIVSVSIAIFISIIVSYILVKKGMKGKFFGKVILHESIEVKDKEKDGFLDLYNKEGKTVTILRPSGIIEIDGKRYDALTEGEFIEKGEEIVVSRVVGSKIFVRRVK